jgi:manganese efflux pump family protein
MEWAALITWVLTAGGGFVLLAIWLSRGGMRQGGEGGSRIRPPLILSHFLLAATGLVIWIIYLADDSDTLAWIAFVILAVVAVLGWTMFAIWWQRRKRGPAAREEPTNVESGAPPEQRFPVPIVALHGVLAVTTVVLVFLTAIGVGGS